MKGYWLYDWIDHHRVRKMSQAEKLLRRAGPRGDLIDRALQACTHNQILTDSTVSTRSTIVAGRGIDLSGELHCVHWECVRREVDSLFSHVLHYFDRIIVAGPSPHLVTAWKDRDESWLVRQLLGYIRTLLYIRDVGAEDLLIFQHKPALCEEHIYQSLREAGGSAVADWVAEQIKTIGEEARISVRELPTGALECVVSHPAFETLFTGILEPPVGLDRDLRNRLAEGIFMAHLAGLSSDLLLARTLEAPLGTTLPFYRKALGALGCESNDDDVAFELNLPVLEGISPKALIRLRHTEELYFERFRDALRHAVRERLRVQAGKNRQRIALEIRQDIVEPALRDIELRLKEAKGTLMRKLGESIGLGSLPTVVGLYSSSPLLMAAGLGPAITTMINAAHKYAEERREARLSNMYFLWEAQRLLEHVH